MDVPCEGCRSLSLSQEDIGYVCTNCGQIASNQADFQFSSISAHCASNDRKLDSNPGCDANNGLKGQPLLRGRIRHETDSLQTERSNRLKRDLDAGKRAVEKVCKDSLTVMETMNLITTIYSKMPRTTSLKKQGLIGACLYLTSSRHQLGLSINDICESMRLSKTIFNDGLKRVRTMCPDLEYCRPSVSALTTRILETMNASNQIISTSHETLKCNVKKLVDVHRLMTHKERPLVDLVHVAIFLSWKSIDTFDEIQLPNEASEPVKKSQVSYDTFCSIFGLRKRCNASLILSEYQSSLVELGSRLGYVSRSDLSTRLSEILENCELLIKDRSN